MKKILCKYKETIEGALIGFVAGTCGGMFANDPVLYTEIALASTILGTVIGKIRDREYAKL